MAGQASAGGVLQEISTAIQSAHEGNLGQLGSLIALIDRVDPGARSPALDQLRDGLADLLMATGDEFDVAFQALKSQVQEHLENPPTEPEPEPEPGEPASLYDRLGGGPAIKAVVESFYEKVLGDALLAPVFAGVDVGALKRHQALFLSQVTGGPREYDGRDLAEAHQPLRITGDQFDTTAAHLQATLTEFSVAAEDIAQVMAVVGAARQEIVWQPEADSAPAQAPAPAPAAQAPATAAAPDAPQPAAGSAPMFADDDVPEGIDPELYGEFVDDAVGHLETIEINFLNLETDPGNRKIIDDIFRPFHTIKGVSGFLGLTEISRVCHETENLLDQGRKGHLEITGAVADMVLEVVDLLKKLLAAVRSSASPHQALRAHRQEAERYVRRIDAVRAGSAGSAAQPQDAAPTKRQLGEILLQQHAVTEDNLNRAIALQKEQGGHLGEILVKEHLAKPMEVAHALRDQHEASKPAEAPPVETGGAVASDSIRVRVNLLDRLMTLAGELVLGRNQLLQRLAPVADDVAGLNSLLHNVDRVTSELQEAVMQTRMQPLSGLFSRFHRIVRDLARSLGKRIDLTVEGENVELDKTLIEALTDPLTHLVRNCADHGVERPDKRAAAGKPETGHISLTAYHEGGRVYVRISDDGAGINTERVKDKAVEKGLITREQATNMSEREAMRLLFLPGFSTAEQVTGVSGRGVGMDVVLRNIQNVGGTVEVTSEIGKGTTFLLALPLTLAIIPALIVSASSQRFAIPQTNLLELVYLEGEDAENAILNVRGSEVYSLRGEMLPLVRLDRVLNLPPAEAATGEGRKALSIVVMAAGVHQFGLLIERVYDTEEIVVQPLSNLLKDVGVFAGATLMGDGKAALILDVAGIMKAAELSLDSEGRGDDRVAGRYDDGDEQKDEQTILLFNVNRSERLAVPLTIISRLETVNVRDIRSSIHGKVIPYRDKLLPLVFLEEHTDIAPPPADRETVKVLVFEIEKPVGLVVTEIIDSLEVSVSLDDSAITPVGFTGLAMVNDQPTAFLDIYQIIELAYPSWFQQDKRKRQQLEDKENIRILLAEDSTFYRNMEKSYLTQEGFQVLEAENGRQALEMLRREMVDLVVTDIEMPEMNGFELTEAVRADEQLRHLPMIAVTSLSQDAERKRGEDAGLDAYLIKLQRELLLREVHRLLTRGRPRA